MEECWKKTAGTVSRQIAEAGRLRQPQNGRGIGRLVMVFDTKYATLGELNAHIEMVHTRSWGLSLFPEAFPTAETMRPRAVARPTPALAGNLRPTPP